MKKLFIIAAAIGVLYSCGGNTQKPQEPAPSEPAQVVDEHNAKNSLDYKGAYSGKVPTASGEGMIVNIELGDSTFVRKIEYVGKKGTFEDKGQYTWNSEGNTVTLEGVKDSPNKYFVGENTLTQLDMDGNKITGDMADMYILKKQ
ncbi:copper resistance protein NlpE [Dysgonomonas sp. 521]|uniref:copper resistance protein NlpE n=1 Tax=Dysgonomonas sp. 521 TaxID=2302932 RepID=UPI0013D00A1D|nr:copper resistance protein NlpE [Dysgonomonas sp. 521]NDV93962.1 copper resistance protein NlpE [Dysgonomonas sp. 521]